MGDGRGGEMGRLRTDEEGKRGDNEMRRGKGGEEEMRRRGGAGEGEGEGEGDGVGERDGERETGEGGGGGAFSSSSISFSSFISPGGSTLYLGEEYKTVITPFLLYHLSIQLGLM